MRLWSATAQLRRSEADKISDTRSPVFSWHHSQLSNFVYSPARVVRQLIGLVFWRVANNRSLRIDQQPQNYSKTEDYGGDVKRNLPRTLFFDRVPHHHRCNCPANVAHHVHASCYDTGIASSHVKTNRPGGPPGNHLKECLDCD